jgi:hypothetical protein
LKIQSTQDIVQILILAAITPQHNPQLFLYRAYGVPIVYQPAIYSRISCNSKHTVLKEQKEQTKWL